MPYQHNAIVLNIILEPYSHHGLITQLSALIAKEYELNHAVNAFYFDYALQHFTILL